MGTREPKLFKTKIIKAKEGTGKLFEEVFEKDQGPVTCLGMEFDNDDARRAYFTEKLNEQLNDPEFRKIEGFPIGEDEDILALSDPPYYTACPNPWINDFIEEWEAQKPEKPEDYQYHREPFAADVSEGKNDPIYNAHSYHTKVPHKAIMRYILHYTEPGDIVFDGFCGTGMTGVAAQMCGDRATIETLDYQVKLDGTILQQEETEDGKKTWMPFSKLGSRKAILNDLSPVATFITNNYLEFNDLDVFTEEALSVVSKVEKELWWLYEGLNDGTVLSAIWSDVFLCSNCTHEFIFWDVALKNGKIQKSFPCPNCGTIVGKAASIATGATKLDRPFTAEFDPILNKIVRIPKFALVEEKVKCGSIKKTYKITAKDQNKFNVRFEKRTWPYIPLDEFFSGRQTNKLINGSGLSYIAHMYTKRALFAYGYLIQQKLSSHKHSSLFKFCLTSINNYISRKQGYFGGGGGVSGTLFTPSLHIERNVFDVLKRKIKKIQSLNVAIHRFKSVTTQSITDLKNIESNTIDYIFTDPPFGESLQYAELNMFVEAWLKTKTAIDNDCVLNYVHKKNLSFYSNMMFKAFKTYSRILKPGRWITIEFHNSQNAVWMAIQQAIEASGLVVADVRILNKQQRSFNAVNRSGAIDQNLILSAYKPNDGFLEKFELSLGTNDTVWNFVRTHLKQLPVFISNGSKAETIAERQNFLLFDRMVAFHVQRNVVLPLSAIDFYQGLIQRFSEREGMYFLPEQVAEYDRKRMSISEVLQLQLFVTDESSAIQWLRQQLLKKPQTTGELNPNFMREISGWLKIEKLLELDELLEQNFICFDSQGPIPEQIHAYLSKNWKELRNLPKNDIKLISKAKDRWYVPDPNKAGDLEKLREKSLLKEFDQYIQATKKLKIIRLEAVRAGFKKAWQEKNYQTIIDIALKIPNKILEEDPKLLMWYDQAITRMDH
jgi:DNA modification methylase